MKIMHTMASETKATRPLRRFYSLELKAQVTQECRQSGASVAGVALSHGINPNIVHRWLREHAPASQCTPATSSQVNGFIALALDEPAPDPLSQPLDIRVEVRRGASSVTVSWPLQGADACTAWLREWLR